ncbi:MAG: GAF domain-containing protein [Deltaproteobacteria bacterium]|nr:GAF domain-containing protein [Deltaproteobacteria bacterium]
MEFLLDVSRILMTSSGGEALELWIRENCCCSRWAFTRRPERFFRLEDAPCSLMLLLAEHGTCDGGDAESIVLPRMGASGGSAAAVVAQRAPSLDPGPPRLPDLDLFGSYRSFVCFPLTVGEETIGLLFLRSNQPDFLGSEDVGLFEDIAQTLAFAVTYRTSAAGPARAGQGADLPLRDHPAGDPSAGQRRGDPAGDRLPSPGCLAVPRDRFGPDHPRWPDHRVGGLRRGSAKAGRADPDRRRGAGCRGDPVCRGEARRRRRPLFERRAQADRYHGQ